MFCWPPLADVGTDPEGGGASSPEELFEEIKTVDFAKMSQVLPYIAPDEHALIVFAMDFAAGFAIAFGGDDSLEDDYIELRKKYKLPEQGVQQEESVDLQDAAKVVAFAQEFYGGVNAKGFLPEVEKFLEKIPGEISEGGVKWKEMNNLKIDGDTASATIVLEDGNSEEVTFLKVGGKWYFSQQATMF